VYIKLVRLLFHLLHATLPHFGKKHFSQLSSGARLLWGRILPVLLLVKR